MRAVGEAAAPADPLPRPGHAENEQGTFDFPGYPLCAAIAASDSTDAVHALTDGAAWGLVNAKALLAQEVAPCLARRQLSGAKWFALCRLMQSLTGRPTRCVEGGHLIFIGQRGAAAAALAIRDLLQKARLIRAELADILSP